MPRIINYESDVFKPLTMVKVLVADDDSELLEVVELVLVIHGFNVKAVITAKDFMEQAKFFMPDVILLDVNIANYDGRELCKELKAAGSPCKHVPVILFSAMHNLIETYSESGADGFLAKPFDTDQLVNKIREHAIEN
ncbi:response regulator [Ginsengibacter hankyongi]|uniref:Response regulator n=1 Tax=Ginsengibacter hankyongi TaxID=2607284 RepID=A0A5J5IGP0_9BACT|nr:response regulator [Ginsengibacter hankyongi]KAA9038356.1 response regulator [Ginsengibacter hankyongi]